MEPQMNDSEQLNLIFKMTNQNRATLVSILYIVLGVMFLIAILFCFAFQQNWLLVFLLLFVVCSCYFLEKMRFSFFELLVTSDELQLNFYALVIVGRNPQSLQFNVDHFEGFAIKKSFMGLRSDLILTVRTSSRLADFPLVSLSLLSKKEIEQVAGMLNSILQKNQS